jgi:stage V sporulation protein B
MGSTKEQVLDGCALCCVPVLLLRQRRPNVAASAAPAAERTGQEGADQTAREAGRGGIAIAGAKVSFLVFGTAQQVVLPWILGKDGYGQVGIVLAIASIVNNTIVATSIQGVSRAVASAPAGTEDQAFRATLRVHLVIAMVVSLAFAVLAGTIADLENAPHLTAPLRVASAVVLLYGVYAPLVGSLNGRRRFLVQAGLDTGYGALRAAAMVGGAYVFLRSGASGVLGVFAGFVAAAAIIVPVALTRTGIGRAGSAGPRTRDYLAFLLPVAGSQILLNLLMFTDGLLLRRFLGHAPDADAFQGIYRGAQQFSFLPYQLLMSVTFILFPMLARAQADGDRAAVRAYTMSGVRLAMILTALVAGTVSGLARHVLRVALPREMADGAEALRILCLGMGAFSVLGVTCAALTGLGRAVDSAVLTAMGVVLIAAGCFVLVPSADFGLPMLAATARAAALGLTLTAVAGGFRLRQVAGGFVRPLTLVRTLAALAACVLSGMYLPWIGKPGAIVEGLAVVGVGVVVLIALGEVGRDDLAKLRAVAGRRRA